MTYWEPPLQGALGEEGREAQPARDCDAEDDEEGLDDEERASVASGQGLGLQDGYGDCGEADAGTWERRGWLAACVL